jgi:hypothetical protein
MKRNGTEVRPDDPNDRLYIAQREHRLADNILLHNGDVIRYNGSTIVFRCPEDHSIDAESDNIAAFEMALRRVWLKLVPTSGNQRTKLPFQYLMAKFKCGFKRDMKEMGKLFDHSPTQTIILEGARGI